MRGADGAVLLGKSILMNIIGCLDHSRRATICSGGSRSGDWMTMSVGLMDRAGHRPPSVGRPEAARCRRTALVNDPSLILADELTGNLGQPQRRALILDLR